MHNTMAAAIIMVKHHAGMSAVDNTPGGRNTCGEEENCTAGQMGCMCCPAGGQQSNMGHSMSHGSAHKAAMSPESKMVDLADYQDKC